MRVILLTCIVALAALTFILLQTPTAEAALGTITVTVQDYHGNPLPNAYVCLRNETGCYQAQTNSNGVATFNNMYTDKTYALNVTYRGIMVRKFTDWDFSNPNHPKTFRTGVFDVKICVKSSGSVQSVAGAVVEVRTDQTEPDLNTEQQTGSDGCATFIRLPGNNTQYIYNVTYNHQVFSIRVESSEAAVDINDSNYNNIVVELPLYRLRLTLQDREGRAVQGLRVNLWRGEKTGQPQLTATSDSNGLAVFSLLPAGSYVYEVVYKDEAIYSVSSPENINANRDRGPITLPLTQLRVEVYDLKNKPLSAYATAYELVARLYADSRLYTEATGSGGVISLGYIYDARDYRLILLFQGLEVAEATLRSDDVQSGAVRIRARFGDFTVVLDSSGFFGALPEIISKRSSIRLEAGGYQLTESFGSAGSVTFRDRPIVEYNYSIILEGVEIGKGELIPAHGESRQVRPSSYTVSIRALSLDERPVAGTVRISYGGQALGTLEIGREGGKIEGLARLPYRYFFTYMDVEVASGELSLADVEAGNLTVRAAVADVQARILDNAGEEILSGAVAIFSAGRYKQESVVGEEGWALFPDAPLTTGMLTVNYQGVKVYSSPVTYSPEQRLLEIRGTGVYTIDFRVLDGERNPLRDAEFKLSVGTLSIAEALNETGQLTLKLIPNGTLSISVNYLGVNVFTGSHRPTRSGETVEVVAKVYGLQVEVYAKAMEGKVALRGAQLLLDREDRRLAEVSTDSGAASLRLPAGNYIIQVNYKGLPVADRVLTLSGSQKIIIEASVYEFAVKVFRLEGSPAPNLTVRFLREGLDEPIEELETSSEGLASTILPEGVYPVVYGDGKTTNMVKLPVKSASTQILLYGDPRAYSFYPLIAAPALAALSIYGLYNSFRIKSKARGPRPQAQERGGVADWARRSRERLRRKNV
ncbi:MAG: hypothetical protein QXQ48_08165 [Nitrososphaerota archaeon]